MYDAVIIDGNNLANKAFYVNGFMSYDVNGVEVKTGVLYGMTSMMLTAIRYRLIDSDSKIFCVWDTPSGSTERLGISVDYKSTRKPSTETEKRQKADFYEQAGLAKMNFYRFRIYQAEKQGFEADDIIATLVRKIREHGNKRILIISEDKDFRQLISETTHCYSVSRGDIWDLKFFREHTGLRQPSHFTDYLALTGDASDNYGGIQGIGKTYACKILNDPFFIENKFEHPVESILVDPHIVWGLSVTERVKGLLFGGIESLRDNYNLAKLYNVDGLYLNIGKNRSVESARRMLEKYGMRSLTSDKVMRELSVMI